MKTRFTKQILIAALSLAGVATAYANTDYGYASTGAAARTVSIDGAKYLNVTRGETVQINASGKSVTWKFDTRSQGSTSFALSSVIPGAAGITVFVADPYLGSTR